MSNKRSYEQLEKDYFASRKEFRQLTDDVNYIFTLLNELKGKVDEIIGSIKYAKGDKNED